MQLKYYSNTSSFVERVLGTPFQVEARYFDESTWSWSASQITVYEKRAGNVVIIQTMRLSSHFGIVEVQFCSNVGMIGS
jgi:hypothetical protein